MRSMTQADVDEVLRIEEAVQAYPWTRGNFIDALARGCICCVKEQGGEVRGYVILMPLLDEAELLNIGVVTVQQRKGLGHAMLLEIFDVAREKNMHTLFLEVRASNAAALALYRSAGFGEIGLRRDYYQNVNGSEDAITMACKLMGEVNG